MAAERVTLVFDASPFVSGMKIAAESAGKVFAAWTLHEATWEPHDWSDFG